MVNPAAHRPRFLAPGDKLGKYELIRQIAVGGMAELYLSRTVGIEGFEKLVVVKRILPQFASNASFVNMFLNEARLAATLHHPNIAQVYDIGQEGTEYFFAMEYIHGEDLGRMVASATDNGVPISLDVALTLVAGLCAGLHYAHDKVGSDGRPLNVVHRDVSPSNVLVSYDGAVKLVDFGIARAGSQPSTTRGGLKGKIGYMSPEQCKGKESLDRRSDIFSIGALLYELTCGRLPFVDETEYGVLNQIVNSDVQPPSQLVPSYPPALEQIVLKALARDRDRRYVTAIELQGDIEDFAHDNRLRVSPLVLARLMGSLFPERLEEWDSARAQGAFFVEQHVVRTLIESGKTSESGVAYEAAPSGKTIVDEDTSISAPPAMPGDNEPTNVHQEPFEMSRGRTPTPRPATPSNVTPLPPPPLHTGVLAPQHAPLSPQHAALSPQHAALSPQHAALSPQHAALSPQHAALSPQHAALPPTAPFPVTPVPRPGTPAPRQPTPRPGTPNPMSRAASPTPTATSLSLPPQGSSHTPQARLSSPVPGMPGAVPIVNPLAAKGGSLVSSAGTYGAPPTQSPPPVTAMLNVGDVTERVRVPSSPAISPYHSDTGMLAIEPRSKLPIVLAVAGAIGVIVATVIVMSGGNATEPNATAAPSKIEMKATPAPEPAPPAAETKPAEPAVGEAKPVEPDPEPAVVETKPAETKAVETKPAETKAVETKPVETKAAETKPAETKASEPAVVETKPVEKPKKQPVAKTEVKKAPKVDVKKGSTKAEVKKTEPKAEPKTEPKAEPKTEPKPEPKEPGKWNADSPFMPVRPADKK